MCLVQIHIAFIYLFPPTYKQYIEKGHAFAGVHLSIWVTLSHDLKMHLRSDYRLTFYNFHWHRIYLPYAKIY